MRKASDAIGVLFWMSAFAAFTFPFWGPIVGLLIGFAVGAAL